MKDKTNLTIQQRFIDGGENKHPYYKREVEEKPLTGAKREGEEVVDVERHITAERKFRAFRMSSKHAEIEKILPPEMQDAASQIEFCFRYRAGELNPTANLEAYGIVSGGTGERVEEVALKLLPDYDAWRTSLAKKAPLALKIVRYVVLEADGLRRAGERAGLIGEKKKGVGPTSGRFLLHGLNEYCILKGWGDVLCIEAIPYFGYVYVIGQIDNGPYKIGYSAQPTRRLRDLQIGSPVPLCLHYVAHLRKGARGAEKELHQALKEYRVRGEWFNMDLQDIIDRVRLLYPEAVDLEIENVDKEN